LLPSLTIMAVLQQRNLSDLLKLYRDHLVSKVSKVYILGEPDERELKDVFVELSMVDQHAPQQQPQFPGLLDSVMWRFNPFAVADVADTEPRLLGPPVIETKYRLRPADLLRRRTRAIITGSPGCGKTTLLKYLTLQAQEQMHLAVWLELKAIDRSLFAQAEVAALRNGHLIMAELWLRHLKIQLSLNATEMKLLHTYWQEKFQAHEVTVLLDGFDELQDEVIKSSLNKSISQFASALHDNALLISTRPYAQSRLGLEHLKEFEIEPLNQRQIEDFLNSYYPNEVAIKSLLKSLRERSSLREVLHVPLLLGVVLRLQKDNSFTDEPLKLYERIINDLVHKLDRSKSVNWRFKIDDRRLGREFLEFLAFQRLLCDPLGEAEPEANRLIFSFNLLEEKAQQLLRKKGFQSKYDPRDIANDALATPLLREIDTETYAFTHLTIQEYLAARAFAGFFRSNDHEALKVFCRAYHNPTIVEMEVLPMMLGLLSNADKLYAEIECWAESLTFANLRLRMRGLAYSANINQGRLSKLIDRFLEFISETALDEMPYKELVVKIFPRIRHQTASLMDAKGASLIKVRASQDITTLESLGQLGSRSAVDTLISTLHHKDSALRAEAAEALGQLGYERSVDALVSAMRDEQLRVKSSAAKALSQIGSEGAIRALMSAVSDKHYEVRWMAAKTLGQVGSDAAVETLFSALKDEHCAVRWGAAEALGNVGSANAAEALISALYDGNRDVRSQAAAALGQLNSMRAVDSLILALGDEHYNVRRSVIKALGQLDSEKAIEALRSALLDEDHYVRLKAAETLRQFDSESAVDALISLFHEGNRNVRSEVIKVLGQFRTERSTEALISALHDQDHNIRFEAIEGLGKVNSDMAVEALISFWQENPLNSLLSYGHLSLIKLLKQVRAERVVETLIETLNDKSSYSRSQAAIALGHGGTRRAIEALTLALKDEDSDVRWNVAEALGQLGSENAVEALISGLNDKSQFVRSRMAKALAQIKVDALIAGLAQTIKRPDAFARKKAALVIPYYCNEVEMLEQLKKLSRRDRDADVRLAARQAAKKFAHKLQLLGHFISAGAAQPLSDNASKEGVLVHEVGLIVSSAGHFFREVLKYDEGIDGEIEFRNKSGRGSGNRVYVQLKSGDSYLRKRKRDGKEIFLIKNRRHAEFWQCHAYPVLLVIRDSRGRIRWMNATEYLQRHGATVKQIEFQGEPFTVDSVRQMATRFVC